MRGRNVLTPESARLETIFISPLRILALTFGLALYGAGPFLFMARPSSFTQDKADLICISLAEGLSLREICRQDDMPDKATVMRWLNGNAVFRDQYVRSKEIGIEALAEDILDIADDASNDWMERHDKDGENIGWAFNGEAAKRSQIRIDARKWILSKLAPKRFGDKVQTTLSGPDGGPVAMVGIDASKLTDEQLRAIASIPINAG